MTDNKTLEPIQTSLNMPGLVTVQEINLEHPRKNKLTYYDNESISWVAIGRKLFSIHIRGAEFTMQEMRLIIKAYGIDSNCKKKKIGVLLFDKIYIPLGDSEKNRYRMMDLLLKQGRMWKETKARKEALNNAS